MTRAVAGKPCTTERTACHCARAINFTTSICVTKSSPSSESQYRSPFRRNRCNVFHLDSNSEWGTLSRLSMLLLTQTPSQGKRGKMIRHFRIDSVRLTAVLAFALFMTGTVAAQVAPPVGPYGFVLNATFNFPFLRGGAAILGLMNFDGAGNVSGPYALEVGSGGANPKQSIAGTFTGTYSTNPDGTGTISMALDNGDNLTLIMVIDNNSRSLQLAA